MKNASHTKSSLPPDQRVHQFVELYVKQHYAAPDLTIARCRKTTDLGTPQALGAWEVTVKWDYEHFTMLVDDLAGTLTVLDVWGTEPQRIFTLVPSFNRGRYALDDPESGADITSGQGLEIRIGGQWISGRVEYNHDAMYVQLGMQRLGEKLQGPDAIGGYYFTSDDGGICGLCAGMRIKK